MVAYEMASLELRRERERNVNWSGQRKEGATGMCSCSGRGFWHLSASRAVLGRGQHKMPTSDWTGLAANNRQISKGRLARRVHGRPRRRPWFRTKEAQVGCSSTDVVGYIRIRIPTVGRAAAVSRPAVMRESNHPNARMMVCAGPAAARNRAVGAVQEATSANEVVCVLAASTVVREMHEEGRKRPGWCKNRRHGRLTLSCGGHAGAHVGGRGWR
ncbi:uncharacterized protein B0I36DRAFT_73001 [Microdochium trichocladiopsis]|uniref:Uncharacterized protein n=1 Tax=Microdochium trichocladiopsis TaxID=1682393 RepID=A0A9P8YFB3_9PEZI|nr:uncharacterized protein B0I36DRAFT_73001 [Microdochium trichocladiopsis]KAH7037941.1 hypothetical protein B0I36DRAFT_73001 [Microdochium trichocladiopsis]